MNSRIVCNQFIAFLALGLLILPGCRNPQAAFKIAASAVDLLTTVAVSIKQVEAATLDVEAKKLEVEGIKKNGEKVTIVQKLSDSQIQQIRETGKAEIKLEDGSIATVTVTVGGSQVSVNPELEKLKNHIAENSFVDFKYKDVQLTGNVSKILDSENFKI